MKKKETPNINVLSGKKITSFTVVILSAIVLFGVGAVACQPVYASYCGDRVSVTPSVNLRESQKLAEGYFTYTSLLVDQLRSQNKKVVLYFYAPWCVTCTSLDKDFTQGTVSIPDDVIVLRLEYDSNPELKTKYGVTLPHTFVYIDASGESIQEWVGDDAEALRANTR